MKLVVRTKALAPAEGTRRCSVMPAGGLPSAAETTAGGEATAASIALPAVPLSAEASTSGLDATALSLGARLHLLAPLDAEVLQEGRPRQRDCILGGTPPSHWVSEAPPLLGDCCSW